MSSTICIEAPVGDGEPHGGAVWQPARGDRRYGSADGNAYMRQLEVLDARLAGSSVGECWSTLDHAQVSWWCEHVAPSDLVKRPALIALWARAHDDAGRVDDALTASRVACSLVDPETAASFLEEEAQFQSDVLKRSGGHATPTANHAEPLYQVSLLGGLEVRVGGVALDLAHWRNNKARTLLVSILLEQGREVSRDLLLDRLWPGRDLSSALNNFYVTWNAMKRSLTPEDQDSAAEVLMPVVNAGQRCSMVRGRCRLDLDDFDGFLGAARAAATSEDVPGALRYYLKLASLYRGQLLCGDVFSEWITPYREFYRSQFLDAMVQASALAVEHGSGELALMFSMKGLSVDRHSEAVTASYMRACLLSGRREDGIHAYHRCRNYLAEELGLDPSTKMRDLYQELIGGCPG